MTTPFESAWRRFEADRARFAREQEDYRAGDDLQAEWRLLMFRAGRASLYPPTKGEKMTATTDVNDFIAAHGGNPVALNEVRMGLPDGASYRQDSFGVTLHDPPVHLQDRAIAILAYHRARLKPVLNVLRDWEMPLTPGGYVLASNRHPWDPKLLGAPMPLTPNGTVDRPAALAYLRKLVAERQRLVTAAEAEVKRIAPHLDV